MSRLANCRRRAFILPVTLVVIGLLIVTLGGFLFFVRAEMQGGYAANDMQQAKLAAESGYQELIALLRWKRDDPSVWWHRPDLFHHGLVWAESYDRQSDPVRELGSRLDMFQSGDPIVRAWRYSIVAAAYDMATSTDQRFIRFGPTPESAKLNINVASDEQIAALITPILTDLQIDNVEQIIDAILDWRDDDDEARANGAETEYYSTLEPPYAVKNGPFDTVEELLLVKNVTAAILYGEDVNRNGILDQNEDDGDASFPFYDNADGILNPGIAPFLTVWSGEPEVATDNQRRININGGAAAIQTGMADWQKRKDEDPNRVPNEVPLSQASLAFISALDQQTVQSLRSPADLYAGAGAPPTESESNTPAPGGALAGSPITLEELPFLMDRFTVVPPAQQQGLIPGRININVAPARILRLLPGVNDEIVAAMIATRNDLRENDPQALRTVAWPVTAGVVSVPTFQQFAPLATTKAYQFHVECVGYADHTKISRRFEWIFEMIGPLPQIRYHRELTQLGLAWPLDDDTLQLEMPQ
ncbi:MAG: general secretion pathway protein GspK [Phycisphaerales bacterium]|nr:general secretion pathway protein GspK [Phycisphaerales bacterium]